MADDRWNFTFRKNQRIHSFVLCANYAYKMLSKQLFLTIIWWEDEIDTRNDFVFFVWILKEIETIENIIWNMEHYSKYCCIDYFKRDCTKKMISIDRNEYAKYSFMLILYDVNKTTCKQSVCIRPRLRWMKKLAWFRVNLIKY